MEEIVENRKNSHKPWKFCLGTTASRSKLTTSAWILVMVTPGKAREGDTCFFIFIANILVLQINQINQDIMERAKFTPFLLNKGSKCKCKKVSKDAVLMNLKELNPSKARGLNIPGRFLRDAAEPRVIPLYK